MQEEVENRTLTLVVSGTKFTGRMLKAAISKYMVQRVFASFGRKLGPETEYLVSRDFLSGREDKELLLIR